MLPLGGIAAFIGRQLGKVLNTAFAWATTALFGRVPADKGLYVSGMALGSLLWPVTVAGVLVPGVATFLLTLVTLPGWADAWVRPVMIALAILIPVAVGFLGTRLEEPRPRGLALIRETLRGYPTAVGLFLVLVWMLVLAPLTKLAAIVRRQVSAHVPIAVKPRGYDTVVRDLADALARAGLPARARRSAWVYEMPGRILAALGGPRVLRLVPERLMSLRGDGFSVVVHPMDLALTGAKGPLARARAAIARELTFTEANQTWTKEAQEIEDALAVAASGDGDLGAIARRIERLELDHEEWETLYRLLLQVRLRRTPLATDALDVEAESPPPLGQRLAAVAASVRAVVAPDGRPSRR